MSQEIRHYWVEKNLPYETWSIWELWPGGVVRSPFKSKQEAVEREDAIAREYGWTVRRVESPMERFPKQYEALRRLKVYQVLQYHDDGDLTVAAEGRKYVVTTEGVTFVHYTTEEALEKILGGTYWWVRLGDGAFNKRFERLEAAKLYVEEETGGSFSEARWINPYGFELGDYRGRNYVSFFEGDDAAHPTGRHTWGKFS